MPIFNENNLIKHPEGGAFQEIYRSKDIIISPQQKSRQAITHIYFQLKTGDFSKFHLVTSDEIWNLYEGALKLYLFDDHFQKLETIELSAANKNFCHVVPANVWQAAEPISAEVIVGCSVAPGFEFADFSLVTPNDPIYHYIKTNHPTYQYLTS